MADLASSSSMLRVADVLSYATEEALNSFPDVYLISSEREILCANRCSLSSSSGFLGQLFKELETSGLLATETEIYVSTEISANNLNAILDYVTTGLIYLPPGPPPDEICFDEEFKTDLTSMGIEMPLLSLSLVVPDGPRRDHKRVMTTRDFHLVSDQSRTRSLDGDILGLALGEVGLEQQGVQVVCQDGTPVIVEHEGVVSFVDNPEDCMDAGPSHRFIDPPYSAGSAKMRRIWKNSRLIPYRKMSEFEAKPRGRPRKDSTMLAKKKSFSSSDFRTEDEKENGERQEVIERPGRRTVKRPRRFDDMCLDRVKPEDVDLDHDDISDPNHELDNTGRPRVSRGRPKLNRSRASDHVSANTCVACGKICKSSYLFKIHLKNFGPFHDNTCAICNAEFKSWEEHIAHLREFHNGQFKYKCGICRDVFDTEERQRIHRHESHTRKDKNKTACEKCGKVVIDYAAHQENFHGTEQHPCPQCPKIFGHVAALRRHIKDNHRQFPCEHCGNIMKNFKKYRLHILSVHTPDNLKPYQCSICTPVRGFATKWNLFEHMNKHNNTRPFKCKTCPATFATTSSRCHHEKACAGSKGAKSKEEMQS